MREFNEIQDACQDTKVLTPAKVSVFICHGPPCELLLAIIYHSPPRPLGQWRIDTWSVWVVDPWGKQHDRNLFRGIFHWKLQRESPPVFRLPITKSHFTVKGFIWLECHCETTKKLNITDEGLAALLRIQGVREKVIEKFTLEQSTKAQRGSRGIALLFL